ncbi:MAG: BatA domain-containing protein [Candidatus Binatia bacterium]
MSLFFLNPLYLFGLLAASVPILIHLLNRRRIKRVRFPAVRFILLSQRRISRTYRLRHWFLLALRTLAIAILVLLLANPIFQTGVGLLATGGPLSAVLVLDNSLSMKWSGDGKGFETAKQGARVLISALKDGDRMAVIPTNGATKTQLRLRGERESLLKELEGLQLSSGTADFASALRSAYELLNQPAAQKEIWLLTDMGLTGWDRFTLSGLAQYDPSVPLKIIKIGQQAGANNATIKELKMQGDGVAVGPPILLEASIVNFGKTEIKDLVVQLSLDGENRDQRLISLPPAGEQKVSFHFNIKKPGSHYGQVALKKEGLAGEPAANFTLFAQDKVRVLLVDGDPQTSLVQSETFFLARVLNPGEQESSLFLPTVVIPESLSAIPLESYHVLILCNVSSIPESLHRKLNDYHRQGGGILFFMGNRVQTDDYNLKLAQSSPPILPGRLRDRRLLSESEAVKVQKLDTAHPVLRGLNEPLVLTALRSTTVRGYFRTEVLSGSLVMSLANGDPLLVEKQTGAGRVLVFLSTADRDWTDLPFKTAYLPLMHSIVGYLAGNRTGAADMGIEVGGTKGISLAPSHAGRDVRFIKPDGKQRDVAVRVSGEKAAATFEENDQAGIYRVSLQTESLEKLGVPEMYPVNPPFLESRMEPIDEADLKAKLSPVRVEIIPIESLDKGGTRMDLSIPLAFLLILTLIGEGWLAQRFST